ERAGSRRAPVSPPAFPPVAQENRARESISVLHIGGPRFGRALPDPGEPFTPEDMQARIWADLTSMYDRGMPRPDLMIVSGDLTESGSLGQYTQATRFVTDLRLLLGLEPHRLVLLPGPRDVTKAAANAYFMTCEADDVSPHPPYWPKWRHFAALFGEVYQGLDDRIFDSGQPWTLFEVPDLKVVVAGLNSTMAMSHLERDAYAMLGEAQAAWFAERLRPYEERAWLRLGAMGHGPAELTDAPAFERLLGHRLNLLFHGGTAETGQAAAPLWQRARPLLDREVERVGVTSVRGGPELLLGTLSTRVVHDGHGLRFPGPERGTYELGERTIVLVPMLAGRDAVVLGLDDPGAVWIAYPVPGAASLWRRPAAPAKDDLSALVGPVRAGLLHALDRPMTMSMLATDLRLAPSGLTYHCDRLRAGRLITRERRGREVWIARTHRAEELLELFRR
ncbi:hypothetical protein ACWEPC_00600, partial [Nonomuraea sp. NPDC004297]